MKQILFLILSILLIGCTNSNQTFEIHGIWVSEKLILPDQETFRNRYPNEKQTEIFYIIFKPTGEIFRISKSKGYERIYGDFRISDNIIEFSASVPKKFKPFGQFIDSNHIHMDFKKGRKLQLKRVLHTTEIGDLELSGILEVEFSQ